MSRAVPMAVQDHHAVLREAIGRSADVHRSRRRLRNPVLCERFRCMGGPSYARSRRAERCQKSDAEEPILRLGWRCIDHEQAN